MGLDEMDQILFFSVLGSQIFIGFGMYLRFRLEIHLRFGFEINLRFGFGVLRGNKGVTLPLCTDH